MSIHATLCLIFSHYISLSIIVHHMVAHTHAPCEAHSLHIYPLHIVFDLKQCISKLAYFEVVKIIYILWKLLSERKGFGGWIDWLAGEWEEGWKWEIHSLVVICSLVILRTVLYIDVLVYTLLCWYLMRRVIYIILVKLKIFAYFWISSTQSGQIMLDIFIP